LFVLAVVDGRKRSDHFFSYKVKLLIVP